VGASTGGGSSAEAGSGSRNSTFACVTVEAGQAIAADPHTNTDSRRALLIMMGRRESKLRAEIDARRGGHFAARTGAGRPALGTVVLCARRGAGTRSVKNLSAVRAPAMVEAMERRECTRCHTPGEGLRRGLCRACYLRAWRGTELPAGATCATCDEQRHAVLRWTRLATTRVVTCQNCGFIADRARPQPRDLDELRLRLARERRARDRRSNYVIDPADPAERRQQPRRARRRVSV
jgi:hypothetical protein